MAKKQKMVTFGQAIKNFWTKYFDFNGCAQRSEYWFWVLFNVLVVLAFVVMYAVAFASGENIAVQGVSILDNLWWVATFIPGIALASRRFHDAGFSAKFVWIPLLAIICTEFGIILYSITMENPSVFYEGNTLVDIALIAFGIFSFVVSVLPSKLKGNPYRK